MIPDHQLSHRHHLRRRLHLATAQHQEVVKILDRLLRRRLHLVLAKLCQAIQTPDFRVSYRRHRHHLVWASHLQVARTPVCQLSRPPLHLALDWSRVLGQYSMVSLFRQLLQLVSTGWIPQANSFLSASLLDNSPLLQGLATVLALLV